MCELPHSDCESNENCCCSRLDDDNGIDICGQRSSISWLAVSLSFTENLLGGGVGSTFLGENLENLENFHQVKFWPANIFINSALYR